MFFYNPLISSIQAAQASLIGIYSFTLTVYNNSKFFSNYVITGLHELESQFVSFKVAHQTYDVIYGVLIPSIVSTIEYLNTTAGNLLYNGAAYVYNNSKFFSNYVITGLRELESQCLLLKAAHHIYNDIYDVIYGVINDMLIPSIISTIEYLNTHPIETTAMIAILVVAVTYVIQENTLGLFCGSSSEELSQIDTNNNNNTDIITTNECVNSYSEIFTQCDVSN